MSELSAAESLVTRWLQPLDDPSAPCGPDLEYDNDFLTLTQAASGKPETQFGPGEPPDWRAVREQSEALMERSRDLRIAIYWLRACMHTEAYGWLGPGLRLIAGLLSGLWEQVHPLPDPDDGDPYARVNVLTLLREPEGLIGDLRAAHVVQDRAVGELTMRMVEVALALSPATSGETELSRDQCSRMLAAALQRVPAMRAQAQECVKAVRELMAVQNDRLGVGVAPDLRPLYNMVNGLMTLMPAEEQAQDAPVDGADGGVGESSGRVATSGGRGLSGAVNSREEALRAIDLVCDYLERAEPTNPAQLFLRRARVLVGANFLQLVKELAPEALADVARIVGVDPDTVEAPERP